jgi:hypothetical protein
MFRTFYMNVLTALKTIIRLWRFLNRAVYGRTEMKTVYVKFRFLSRTSVRGPGRKILRTTIFDSTAGRETVGAAYTHFGAVGNDRLFSPTDETVVEKMRNDMCPSDVYRSSIAMTRDPRGAYG